MVILYALKYALVRHGQGTSFLHYLSLQCRSSPKTE
jgi:hypothetical protein